MSAGHHPLLLPPALLLQLSLRNSETGCTSAAKSTPQAGSAALSDDRSTSSEHQGQPISCTRSNDVFSLDTTGCDACSQVAQPSFDEVPSLDRKLCAVDSAGFGDSDGTEWIVPAGVYEHQQVVAWGTVIATLLCTSALLCNLVVCKWVMLV